MRKHAIFAAFSLSAILMFFVGLFTGTVPLVVVGAAALLVLFVLRSSFMKVS